MTTEASEPSSPNGSGETTPPEPWWKKAPQGPPPRWASPTAVRRLRLRQTVLPSRLTARGEASGTANEAPAEPEP